MTKFHKNKIQKEKIVVAAITSFGQRQIVAQYLQKF